MEHFFLETAFLHPLSTVAMANDMCKRRLTRELMAMQKNPMTDPTVLALPNEANILEWHYVIEGSTGTPYAGGHYHGKLIFPKEYPLKPPSVIMLTPSGRFKPNRRLCLSMSDFHPESWNPMWSVSTILTGLYSFMNDSAPTLGSIETSDSHKRRLARQSLAFNVNDASFCRLFPELVKLHEERVRTQKKVPTNSSRKVINTISTDGGVGAGGIVAEGPVAMQGLYAAAAGVIAILSIIFAMRFI